MIGDEFDRIGSAEELRTFVARFQLKELHVNSSSKQTIGEWTGAIDSMAVYLRHRLGGSDPSASGHVVSLTVTSAAGQHTEREIRFT